MNSIDIAKIAGVSRSTVSRVINNYPNVPVETKEKVLAVIKKYNYVPHASARMLAGFQNRTIGLFISATKMDNYGRQVTTSSYFTPFIGATVENSNKHGYNVLVSVITKAKDFNKVKEIFYNKTITGGIFIGQKNNSSEIREIIESGQNVAIIDQSVNSDEAGFSKCIIVNADNFDGGYNATKYLIELGHTKIAHITGEASSLSAMDRLEGYKKALKDAGIPLKSNMIVKEDFMEEGGYKATCKLLSKDKPTAIFVGNDSMAIGAINAIQDHNLKVPEDISIIGFDDIEVARSLTPSLTTMKMALLDMANIAANNLISAIENKTGFSAKYVVPVELIVRNSCAKVK